MDPIQILAILNLFYLISVKSACKTDCQCSYFHRCADTNKVHSDGMLEEVLVDSRAVCLHLCSVHENCKFALHNPETRRCRLHYNDSGQNEEISRHEWQCWSDVDCGQPASYINQSLDVQYTSTTYQSKAKINRQCDLGKYSESGQSECQADGQWSAVVVTCRDIPQLIGRKALPTSNVAVPSCRSVTGGNYACNADEILTGCSMNSNGVSHQTYGQYIRNSVCKTDSGVRVARCCKIPGFRCEYMTSITVWSALSCYKGFHLHDCSCVTPDRGACPVSRTNNSCNAVSPGTWRRITCCTHERLSCYTKVKSGQGMDSKQLTIACPHGEIMTACNGHNTDRSVHKNTITEKDGVSECWIHAGIGNISTLVGYATCCKNTTP